MVQIDFNGIKVSIYQYLLKLLNVTLELFQMFIKVYMNYPQAKNWIISYAMIMKMQKVLNKRFKRILSNLIRSLKMWMFINDHVPKSSTFIWGYRQQLFMVMVSLQESQNCAHLVCDLIKTSFFLYILCPKFYKYGYQSKQSTESFWKASCFPIFMPMLFVANSLN